MSIEINVRIVDPLGELRWERTTTYFNEHMFRYPEYREAVFAQAGRLMGDRLATELGFPVEVEP